MLRTLSRSKLLSRRQPLGCRHKSATDRPKPVGKLGTRPCTVCGVSCGEQPRSGHQEWLWGLLPNLCLVSDTPTWASDCCRREVDCGLGTDACQGHAANAKRATIKKGGGAMMLLIPAPIFSRACRDVCEWEGGCKQALVESKIPAHAYGCKGALAAEKHKRNVADMQRTPCALSGHATPSCLKTWISQNGLLVRLTTMPSPIARRIKCHNRVRSMALGTPSAPKMPCAKLCATSPLKILATELNQVTRHDVPRSMCKPTCPRSQTESHFSRSAPRAYSPTRPPKTPPDARTAVHKRPRCGVRPC